ncbi:ABC transporter substrate-binding protein [Streptomyces sp. NPDC006602]|uniref:ABC transporter substrate-binding protein n=1 Tax=Streptomyces sp. NPDC006602 TaxID=3364751 RepID=UPI0036CA697B
MTARQHSPIPGRYSRRGFMGLAGAALGSTFLAACGSGSSGGSGGGGNTVKFWDTPWGPDSYINAAKTLVQDYKPSSGHAKASYQTIPWANFLQTFSSAIASKTGPTASSGAAYQALQYFKQGAIAPADKLVAKMKTQDYLDGIIEPLKYQGSYVAVPWAMDFRVLYYRKSLLEKAGADVPTDWDSLRAACVKLNKIGVSGFGMAGGSGLASQQVLSLMFNNGGGMFDQDGKPDCVTDRNIETLDLLRELVSVGAIQQRYVSYTPDNLNADFASGKVAMAFNTGGQDLFVPPADRDDVLVASPLTGPHGDKGTLYFLNNLMMYKTPVPQEDTEAFLTYYLDNMQEYWKQGIVFTLPVRKSIIDLPEFQKNANRVKIAAEWQPVGRTEASVGTHLFPSLNAVDGGQALTTFSQQVIQGRTSSRTLLENLQKGITAVSG